MELRTYQEGDSAAICSWIKDEKTLYQWTANTIGKFPLPLNVLDELYLPMMKENKIIPFCTYDEEGNLVGHFRIRYPNETDKKIVRIGYVIVNPAFRGQGNGQRMLQLGIDYAKTVLGATRITLGVFANNERALRCYEAVGFRPAGKTEICQLPIGDWECIEMEFTIG